jgi:NLR family CARD domain-containing protein 3
MGESSYVKKDTVVGSSFEVGAKVTYEGREMTVSQAPDSDGDIKMIDPSGFLALCAALPAMKELKDLKYALIRCRFPDVHSVR